jgi:hypothetical protein
MDFSFRFGFVSPKYCKKVFAYFRVYVFVIPAQAGFRVDSNWTPACETVSYLLELLIFLSCHSGLDPESSAVSTPYDTGCRIESGMTVRKWASF